MDNEGILAPTRFEAETSLFFDEPNSHYFQNDAHEAHDNRMRRALGHNRFTRRRITRQASGGIQEEQRRVMVPLFSALNIRRSRRNSLDSQQRFDFGEIIHGLGRMKRRAKIRWVILTTLGVITSFLVFFLVGVMALFPTPLENEDLVINITCQDIQNFLNNTQVQDEASILMPNPVLQCQCVGSVRIIYEGIRVTYHEIKEKVPYISDDSALWYPLGSCNPQNLAMLWLAWKSQTLNQTFTSTRLLNQFVLAQLYAAWPQLNGYGGWLTEDDECIWKGISCDEDDDIQKIDLKGQGIKGPLGSMPLAHLSGLRELNLTSNKLHGTIPILPKVETLLLNQNELRGTIPTETREMTNLRKFGIGFNKLSGTIPSQIARLSRMEELQLGPNRLTGSFPSFILSMTSVRKLSLKGNRINGTIPTLLTTLPALTFLDMSQTSLSGTLPTEIGAFPQLKTLFLSGTALDGSIPASLGDIASLEKLNFSGTRFSGPIPTTLGQLLKMEDISFASMRLSGTLPSEIGRLTRLRGLSLFSNKLTGRIPTEFGQLTNLDLLELQENSFVGSVPQRLCGIQALLLLADCVVECPCCFECCDENASCN